jgi:hypothetical protein
LKAKLVDALVWVVLAVVVPGVVYAMSVEPKPEDNWPKPHDTTKCSVCRHYRGIVSDPPPIEDPAMVLLSPGHPHMAHN